MKAVWTAFGLLTVLLAVYIILLAVDTPLGDGVAIQGWGVDGFEFCVACLVLSKALVRQPRRAMPLFLGFALLSWCAGDIALTVESLGGATPAIPSVADGFYLCFYPLCYVAVFLFMRGELRRLASPSWLDGAVAGLGAAAVCSAVVFDRVLASTGGHPLAAVVNLAYPIGDLVLLALVVGATAVMPGTRKAPWLLLSSACALNAVGDTFNLFGSTVGSAGLGLIFNAIAWPGAFTMMALAVWLRPRGNDPLAAPRATGFLLPGLAAAAGLAILLAGTLEHMSDVSVSLAAATLFVVGIRLGLSARGLRLLTEQRHRQSMTDELTGLHNRRYLFQVLNSFFADATDPLLPVRSLAFLFVDLDHFKEINDSFGHHAGDALLRQIGPRLTASLRASDVLVRLGGDEFAVVLLDADAAHAITVAEKLLASLRQPFLLDVMSANIGASIGIAIAPTDAADATALLRCADVAMYRGKLRSDSIETYNLQLDDDGNLLRLAEELRTAVEQGQFILHYQPQLDLRSGQISGVEALLRWNHPRLGLVPPLKFIPVAEEAGLMPSLTAIVLDGALGQCATWRADGHEIAVSVNISPSNLLDTGFTELVRKQLERHGLPSTSLVLEITETCIISDYERSRAVIQELRDTGITISIDDFGAGFTSLAYLSDLAVGELKLDRTFVTGLFAPEKARDLDLVRSTIELGHALGLRVIAEGVEDLATLDKLGQLGCDFAQGYYISMPSLPEDVVLHTTAVKIAEAVGI